LVEARLKVIVSWKGPNGSDQKYVLSTNITKW
jgi:hypothetical protein